MCIYIPFWAMIGVVTLFSLLPPPWRILKNGNNSGYDVDDEHNWDPELNDQEFYDTVDKIDELNKTLKFYKLQLTDGHYSGTQIEIDYSETPDEWYFQHYFDFEDYGVNRYILRRMINAERKRINRDILPLFRKYGFEHYAISARFSNGETWYSKVA